MAKKAAAKKPEEEVKAPTPDAPPPADETPQAPPVEPPKDPTEDDPAASQPPETAKKSAKKEAKEPTPLDGAAVILQEIERDLSKRIAELQDDPEASQERCETIRLGASQLLRSVQAKAVEIRNDIDGWNVEYQKFLREKASVDDGKAYINDLSARVAQQQSVFQRSKDITDVQFQNLIALCNLPDEKFQMLLS
jgi:hypothetical protein